MSKIASKVSKRERESRKNLHTSVILWVLGSKRKISTPIIIESKNAFKKIDFGTREQLLLNIYEIK